MNMKAKFLIALCSALSLYVEVYADGENDVRRGLYPYMAFIYYPDESVVDATGARFLRGAILIRSEWLVTAAVGPSVVTDAPNGFPRKTLLARLGAINIDSNFTLNEDEDEQEREIIEIVRPYNHSATQWWRTDISLMKALLAFNITSAVGIAHINPKGELGEKSCIILVYARKDGNDTEDRTLIQLSVEMQRPSIQNCGSHFSNTMACAIDSEDNKNAIYDENFCQGNSGGPLICENDVVGIQTYIDNDCKQPHLYQLLSAWDNFITCGTQDKCHEEQCSNICDVASKDVPVSSTLEETKASSESPKTTLLQPESSPMLQTTSNRTELTSEDSEMAITPSTINLGPEEVSTVSDTPSSSVTGPTNTQSVSDVDIPETTKSWPNEKDPEEHRKIEQADIEHLDRKPTVEARRHHAHVQSAGPSNVSNTLSIFFGFFILACLI